MARAIDRAAPDRRQLMRVMIEKTCRKAHLTEESPALFAQIDARYAMDTERLVTRAATSCAD